MDTLSKGHAGQPNMVIYSFFDIVNGSSVIIEQTRYATGPLDLTQAVHEIPDLETNLQNKFSNSTYKILALRLCSKNESNVVKGPFYFLGEKVFAPGIINKEHIYRSLNKLSPSEQNAKSTVCVFSSGLNWRIPEAYVYDPAKERVLYQPRTGNINKPLSPTPSPVG